jgi:hypothetical protein
MTSPVADPKHKPSKRTLAILAAGEKRCSRCKVVKPLAEFWERRAQSRGARACWCKPCQRDAERERNAADPSRPLRVAHQNRKKNYGMTAAEFDTMICEQAGRCAACDDPFGQGTHDTHVDHCHTTGRIRGLLCHRCNKALGNVRDSVAHLMCLVDYLGRTD